MKLKKLLISSFVIVTLSGCTTTLVERDTSGTRVVDVLYAKYAQEVQTALNRLADTEDLNKVNVLASYDTNTIAENQSYNGVVTKQNKIVIPDTYPQTQWRDDAANSYGVDYNDNQAPTIKYQ